MLRLGEAPLGDHLVEEDGLVYPRELVIHDDPVPGRFSASVLVEGAAGPPWHMIVVGLESDRFGMRARFEAALATADARQRARLSTALSACYSGLFGFRARGPGRAGFDAWVEGLPIAPDRETPLSPDGPVEIARLVEEAGCQLVTASPGTGHVPVGHDLLFYLLAEVERGLEDARFDEVASFDPDEVDREDGPPLPYTLRAWLGGRRYEGAALGRGDCYDAPAALALLNAILRELGTEGRFRALGIDGGHFGYGSPDRLLALDDEDW
jgi:hypothetical protein